MCPCGVWKLFCEFQEGYARLVLLPFIARVSVLTQQAVAGLQEGMRHPVFCSERINRTFVRHDSLASTARAGFRVASAAQTLGERPAFGKFLRVICLLLTVSGLHV